MKNFMKKIILLMFLMVFSGTLPSFCAETSLDEMIGQMIILGFKGNSIHSKGFKEVANNLKEGKISGVIFFDDNIKNKEDLDEMTKILYNARMAARPFLSVDMEGGQIQVMNAKNGFINYPAAAKITEDYDIKKAYEIYSDMANTLNASLLNLSFAPCVDLDLDKNSIIHKKQRSYSDNPDKVTAYAAEFIKAHADKGIVTTLKHFPGHGSVSGDTHLNFVDGTASHKEIELYPYENLMFKNDLQMVMVSHIFNENYDNIYPASLSYNTITGILRRSMGFSGVVITDDLDMGAVRQNYDLEDTVIQAINAGNDILLFSNRDRHNPSLADDINKIIKNAILDGLIEPARIQQSYERIMKLKKAIIANEKK